MITLNFKVGDTIRLKKDPNKKDNKRRTKAKITAKNRQKAPRFSQW